MNNDVIKSRTLQLYFFGALFFTASVLTLMVLWPFLNSIAIAFVLAIVFKPLYRYFHLRLKINSSISSAASILVIGLVIVLPLSLLFSQILQEARPITRIKAAEDIEEFIFKRR